MRPSISIFSKSTEKGEWRKASKNWKKLLCFHLRVKFLIHCPFLKIDKNYFVSIYGLNFSFKTQFWEYLQEGILKFVMRGLSFVCCRCDIYRSVLIPRNHTYLEQFLVVHLIYIIQKSDVQIESIHYTKRMLFSVCFHSERLTFVYINQVNNQKFLRVGVVLWNKDRGVARI